MVLQSSMELSKAFSSNRSGGGIPIGSISIVSKIKLYLYSALTGKQIHMIISILPNLAESVSLIIAILILKISGFYSYYSIPGFYSEKCNPVPHRAPDLINRLMGKSWKISDKYTIDTRVSDEISFNSTEVDFPISFFACESMMEVIFLAGSLIPLICAVGEFLIMYFYRKRFKLEDGRIVPK